MTDDNAGFPVNVEAILAAVLKTVGPTEVHIDQLVRDYSNYQIAVTEGEEGHIVFELIEVDSVS